MKNGDKQAKQEIKGDVKMEYKIEELKFYNMKTSNKYVSGATNRDGKYKIFEIEDQLDKKEKIKFIDEQKEGVASYLLKILATWEMERNTLPKNNWGNEKTVSKKAWIKRNDERKIIDIDYQIGTYYLFGTKFKNMDLICPTTEYSYNMAYTGENVVEQWFHDLCNLLYKEEQKYFQEHDIFQIKLNKLRELGNQYNTVFDSQKLNDIVWNRKDNVTEQKLDEYINAYRKLEQTIKQISDELSN